MYTSLFFQMQTRESKGMKTDLCRGGETEKSDHDYYRQRSRQAVMNRAWLDPQAREDQLQGRELGA